MYYTFIELVYNRSECTKIILNLKVTRQVLFIQMLGLIFWEEIFQIYVDYYLNVCFVFRERIAQRYLEVYVITCFVLGEMMVQLYLEVYIIITCFVLGERMVQLYVGVYKNACYVFQKEDGPDIRGGSIDALVVHATAANKTGK